MGRLLTGHLSQAKLQYREAFVLPGKGASAPPLQGTFSHAKRRCGNEREAVMSILKWALIMLLVSLVAALLGFTDLSAASADVARVLFYIFGVIFLVLLVLGFTVFRSASRP